MYTNSEDKVYWKKARMARRLTLAELADRLSDVMGEKITRDQLSNWEYKSVRAPREPLRLAIAWQIREWRREDCSVKESEEFYGIDHTCESCKGRVPGIASGAEYCLLCGIQFRFRTCDRCGLKETREGAKFCSGCGKELPPL